MNNEFVMPEIRTEPPLPTLRNVAPDAQRAKHLDFSILTFVEYYPSRMQDRVVSKIYANGKATGVFASALVDDEIYNNPAVTTNQVAWARRAMDHYGSLVEAAAIDEFLGMGHRQKVEDLEREFRILKEHFRALQEYVDRIRWWQVRRRIAQRRHEKAMALESGR